MNELTLLLKNNRLAVAAAGGVVLGMAARSLIPSKGKDAAQSGVAQRLDITPEQFSHISNNPEGCIRYETERGIIVLFAVKNETH